MFDTNNHRYLPLRGDNDSLFLTEEEVRRMSEWSDEDLHHHIRDGDLDCVECQTCGQRYYRALDCLEILDELQSSVSSCPPISRKPTQP